MNVQMRGDFLAFNKGIRLDLVVGEKSFRKKHSLSVIVQQLDGRSLSVAGCFILWSNDADGKKSQTNYFAVAFLSTQSLPAREPNLP